MIGNAGEWTDYIRDGWSLDAADGHYGEDLIDPIGPSEGVLFAVQGGWFKTLGCYNRAAAAITYWPNMKNNTASFRPVRNPFRLRPARRRRGRRRRPLRGIQGLDEGV